MLQRIQTIWLLLAFVCGFMTIKFPFYSGNKPDASQVVTYTSLLASGNLLILVLTVVVFMMALIAVFLYKNRKLQMRITLLAVPIALLNIYLYYRATRQFINGDFSISALLSVAIPVFLLLAARSIYKDEKLVKSMDRLR